LSVPVRICAVDEIDDPGAREFPLPDGAPAFLVRRGDVVRAYRNRCPHMGRQLNWGPHRFLNRAGDRIMCAAHGAVFEVLTGRCVGGPCPGAFLERIGLRVTGGEVFLHPGEAG
jgi:nitrite reductase/ring-hydroxylating ferredoxin subunit